MGTSRRLTAAWALLAGVMLLAAAPQAGAAMPGLYFSGFYMDSTLAYSTADVSQSLMEEWRGDVWREEIGWDVLTLGETKFDRTDVGYSFGVGYLVSQYFAAELSYMQLGEARYTATGLVEVGGPGGSSSNTTTYLRTRARGLGFSGIASWPIGDRLSLDARGGVLLGNRKVSYTAVVQGFGYTTGKMKDGAVSFHVGAGINFSMAPGTAIRLGYAQSLNGLYDKRGAGSWLFGVKYAW